MRQNSCEPCRRDKEISLISLGSAAFGPGKDGVKSKRLHINTRPYPSVGLEACIWA